MKKNILLVEYAASTIDTIKEILSHPIFNITVLNEGDTAKNFLTKKKFDMLITAAMLPKFHGFSLSLYASTHSPGIKIIIISEIYKGMDYKHQAISQYKAHDFFEKPLDKKVFKKRVLELLGINENDLMQKEAGATTAIQTPVPDTKKIPTLKKIREDKDRKILSSEDIFGDIIKGVQEVPPFEIKLEENKEEEKPKTGKEDAATQLLDKTDIDEHKALKKTKIPTTEFDTRKIDMDLENLMKTQKIVKEKKETQKFKKIEDDISKKFEETLSGLGIGTSDKKPILKDTRPIKIPEPPGAKPPPVPVEIVETKEKRDEVGGYEILGPIARGGMAEIYKAKKKGIKGFEKMIALKKILSGYGKDDKYVEMFVDEAKIAAELTHPNIVQIYDLGKKDDYYFIAMEYVAGKDLRLILRKLMDSKKLFPEELSLYLILEVLKALNYAHSAKNSSGESLDIVHRDISPPNILVSFSGDVKLTDFGVSKASIKLHQTIAGALKGKLLYMSPEQARGDKYIDYRSDLYSVGIILFELITGQKLFMGTSEMAVLKKVQKGEIIKPSQLKKDIDPELETFILKMLNKDMNKRYQKASDIINDLQAYINKNYTHAPTPIHLSYAIYNLFEEEIKKEGIKIDLKPIPYEIKRVKKEAKKTPEEEPLQKEEEVVEALEENIIEPEEEETIKEEIDEKPIEEEEFQPLVEIDFADNDLLKEEPVKKREAEEVSEPELIQPEFTEIEEEFHKKKKYILIALGVIIILGALIAFYLIIYSAGEKKEPFTLQKPGITDKKPARDSDIAAADTDTGTVTETTSRLPVPKVETEVTYKTDTITKEPQEEPLKPLETTENLQSTVPVTDQVKKPPEEEPGKREQTPIKTRPKEELEKETEKATPGEVQKQLQQEELLKQKRLEEVKSKVEEQKKLEAEGIELKEGQILSITEVDSPPVAISTPPVEITQRDTRIIKSGENVFVSYLVDHNGNVESVRFIRKSSSKKINVLIEKTISGWKFKPALKNNIKVKVWKTVSLTIKK
jgi:serine/threonine protein kinase/DNA-binding response OmpR family regulator